MINILLPLTQLLFIVNEGHSAPKLGGVLFEQLFLETFIDDGNNTNARYKKRAFHVPTYRVNIKNTTSIYAKLTGNSMRNAVTVGSEHKYKEIKEDNHARESSNSTASSSSTMNTTLLKEIATTDTIPMSISSSLLTTSVLKNASYTSNPVKPRSSQSIQMREKAKVKTGRKSTPKDTSKIGKNRRDGEVLQSNGYAFNEDNCQMRGDRVLCGYNNQAPPHQQQEPPIARSGDCILRGDRVECGYKPLADNRRNNKQEDAKRNESELHEAITNFTAATTITSDTSYSATTTNITTPTPTTEFFTTETQKDELNISVFETQKIIDRIDKIMASIIMHSKTITASPTTITDTDILETLTNASFSTTVPDKEPKISDAKIQDLIERVEKLIASISTNSTSAGTTPNTKTPTESAIEKKLSKALELLTRIEKLRSFADTVSTTIISHSSPEISANITSTTTSVPTAPNSTTVDTSTVTDSTTVSTSTATNSTTTNSTVSPTTPISEPYIDDKEFCIEKDGRIVCYDNINDYYSQEVYDDDDYLVK